MTCFLGLQLLIGGKFISLYTVEPERPDSPMRSDSIRAGEEWREAWSTNMSLPQVHLKFSPDGTMFASAAVVSTCTCMRTRGQSERGEGGRRENK